VRGAPWTPTPQETVRKMLELADVTQDDTVVDLGSGDGRIIIMAAKEFGARAIGIEVDPSRILWSRWNVQRSGMQEKVQVVKGNFFDLDLSGATVVTVFQRIGTNNRLKAKLISELKPGTRIVSYIHLFEGWSPVVAVEDSKIYLYMS
jgi:precorrin-6B methylase 2